MRGVDFMEEILVDENGYQQYLKEIEKLNKLSVNNLTVGSEAYKDAIGDGWHDNFAFEQAMIEDRSIATRINNLLAKKDFIKVIKIQNLNSEIINIGDILVLEIKYADNDIERVKIKLTGNYCPTTNLDNEIQEITLNSPLGKAIYQKNINDEYINYMVQNKKIEIKVIEKIKN